MLQLRNIQKSYTTSSFTQVALDDVSLAFRDNEFVSILGPSGSGKTTLLNVVGGLDHFDSGDLVIDGVSTKDYRDRDWDAYRNNRIGFVFQSYNLIPHQTILSNVELALTLSGVSPAERRERARQALVDVGLGEHVDKRPSQLSGGQMQRVAIARALINDPEILLADEPTGALDSKTSVQVMDLLRDVAKDRLVIMVTHNPDLAHQYSTRIVELADGRICSDSDPYDPADGDERTAKPPRRTSMSFLTALSLSFNNLMTKKGRTLMTAFAGSIGIIGIAAILALANGVNAYIQEVEEETLSVYPLQIMSSGFDITSMLVDAQTEREDGTNGSPSSAVSAGDQTVGEVRMVTDMFGRVGKNDLAALKTYLDDNGGDVQSYVQDIEYSYGVVPQIFADDTEDGVRKVNPDTSFAALGIGGSSSSLMSSSSAFSTNVFAEMPADLSLVEDQFDVRAGRWPTEADELVLVLSRTGRVSDFMSYAMGLRDHEELEDMVAKLADQEDFEAPTDERTYTVSQLMDVSFRVVPASRFYEYEGEYKVWTDKSDDKKYLKKLVEEGLKLKIVGVVSAKEDVDAVTLTQGIYYTPKLTRWLMDEAASSKIVKEQLKTPSVNVISGKRFDAEAKERADEFDMSSLFSIDQDKIAEAFKVDPSALDLSSMDLSGLGDALDVSELSSLIDLSDVEFDLSGIDLSGVDLSKVFTPELLEPFIITEEDIDLDALLDGVVPSVDNELIQQTLTDALAGFPEFLTARLAEQMPQVPEVPSVPVAPSESGDDTGAAPSIEVPTIPEVDSGVVVQALADYLAQPEVSAQIASGLSQAVSIPDDSVDRMGQNLADQIRKIQDRITDAQRAELEQAAQDALDELVSVVGPQIAETLGTQFSEQVGTRISQGLGAYLSETITQVMQTAMEEAMGQMAGAFSIDEKAFAEAFAFKMDQQELTELMMAMMTTERTSLDGNLTKLGYADPAKPSEIDIYANNFDDKAKVTDVLDAYNARARAAGDDDRVITYTDIVGALMSSVTDIVNMISYVLIAFVAISLVVSSIMIGVITYISVLERKKEIGILRSIGASKRDISRVFNAETIIEGLVSGLMGVGLTALATIPVNAVVEANFDVVRVARLPLRAAVVLVGVSVFLSFVAGLLPSRKAAKADPVEALRSE